MKLLRNIIFGIIIGLIILGLFARVVAKGEVEEEIDDDKVVVSLISSSELDKNTTALVAYGTAAATEDMDLTFEMSGVVDEVYVWPGAWVEKGMALAKLESDSMDAQIAQAEAAYDAVYHSYLSVRDSITYYDFAQAEAALEMAEIQLEAMKDAQEAAEEAKEDDFDLEDMELSDLSDAVSGILMGGAPSDTEIEIQELVVDQYQYAIRVLEQSPSEDTLASQWAYVEQAQAALQSAYDAYNSLYLQAPFEGEVTTVSLDENQIVQAGVSVGKIVNRDNVEAETYLSTEEAASISVGNNVLIDDEYEGQVIGISSRVDDYTGKIRVRIAMDSLYEYTTGDSVTMEIEQDVEEGITLVPLSAFLFDDEDSYIFFYYDGAVYKRLVDARDVLGDYVEVYNMPNTSIVEDISGLRSGQEVTLSL